LTKRIFPISERRINFVENGTQKWTHGSVDNYYAIMLACYHGIRNRQSIECIWYIGTMKHAISLDNIGIPFVIPKAHLDAICVPVTVSMSHLQMQQSMKSHLSISIW